VWCVRLGLYSGFTLLMLVLAFDPERNCLGFIAACFAAMCAVMFASELLDGTVIVPLLEGAQRDLEDRKQARARLAAVQAQLIKTEARYIAARNALRVAFTDLEAVTDPAVGAVRKDMGWTLEQLERED
jgi:hypothetical protein